MDLLSTAPLPPMQKRMHSTSFCNTRGAHGERLRCLESRSAAIRIATGSQRFQIARFESQGRKPFESLLRLYYFLTDRFPIARFLREAKPGGFQTGGFPLFFGKGPDCVADFFGTVPRRCSYYNRLRKREGTNRENPRTIPEQIGKIPKKSGKSQKGQKRKDGSRSGKPPV